jgi:hypothetical protein
MVAREAIEKLSTDDPLHQRLHEASGLLARLLMQDIERREDGAHLKQGVSSDRIVSVHDPEMRHGRKSARRRFDGHKAAIAVDPESQLITERQTCCRATPRITSGHWSWWNRQKRVPTPRLRRQWETVHTGTVRLVNYLLMLGGNW